MDFNSFNSLFSFIMLFCGLYCFYAWYQLRDGKIPEKFMLLNQTLPADQCLDQEYYTQYMRPRLLVFAIVITLFAGFGILDARFALLESWVPAGPAYLVGSLLVNSVIPFGVIVWFCICLMKIQKELW